jgi:hypothetical protein
MTFAQRLKFYGIGFGIGLLMVFMIFGNRSCVSVNEQKMAELVAYQQIQISEKAQCKLKCLKSNDFILKLMLRNFEVNYDISNVHAQPCGQYFVKPKEGFKYDFDLVIQDCDTISKILDINITNPQVNCNCQ